ncbi:hypothetical protein CBL_20095 [Carabus blaptoides fortunei]
MDSLQLKIDFGETEDVKKIAESEKELHLRKAELARSSLNSDKVLANENIFVFTFDLEKALAFPKLSCSVAYYKTNMYVYNLGFHSFNDNTGYMFMWDETQESRGSQEIASCLVNFLKKHASTHSHIIMYSDCCTSQNRNIKISLSLLKLAQDPEMTANYIDHKFLTSGHSYLPNDADFGVIESKAKRKNLFMAQVIGLILSQMQKEQSPFK